ncbi:MAG: S8 family serine peptidase, partial [Rhodothermaceae bacterium]|nr:S8 family serine peptidase [Rhodothermaceae bacterium]
MHVSDRLHAALAVVALLLFTATTVRADDRVKAETRVDQVRAEYGLTGEDVIIAILDRGIDYEHPDFRNADGTTRILAIYDLTDPSGASDPANPTGVGTVYTRAEIDAALAGGSPLAHRDAVGHGTSTAGLAGGNGRASDGEIEGMAPNATFVIVKFTTEGAPAHDGEPAEAPFYNPGLLPTALDYVLGLADAAELPIVFLANFGSVGGPMDGTSDFAQAIDSRFGAGIPGRIFVTGTSDDGGVDNHAGGTVGQGQTVELQFQKGYAGFLRINLWYPDSDRFGVEVVTPSGSSGPLATPMTNGTQASASGTGFTYFHNGSAVDFFGADNDKREILIDFSGVPGTYTLRLTGTAVADGRFDASLNPSNFYAQPDNRFLTFVEEGYQ